MKDEQITITPATLRAAFLRWAEDERNAKSPVPTTEPERFVLSVDELADKNTEALLGYIEAVAPSAD